MKKHRILRGLRLNCFLAGLLPAFAAAIACLLLGVWVQSWQQQEQLGSARLALDGYVAGLATGTADGMSQALVIDRLVTRSTLWEGAQQLTIDGEGLVQVLASYGELRIDHNNIPPELTWAVAASRAWWDSAGRLCAAAPQLDQNGQLFALIYVEGQVPVWSTMRWFAIAAALIAVGGLLMAWYLVRRIYQPVEALSEQALAAVSGKIVAPLRSSLETEALASAMSELTESYIGRQVASKEAAARYSEGETQDAAPSVPRGTKD